MKHIEEVCVALGEFTIPYPFISNVRVGRNGWDAPALWADVITEERGRGATIFKAFVSGASVPDYIGAFVGTVSAYGNAMHVYFARKEKL